MQTEMEKMRSGRQYCFADAEVAQSISRAQRLCAKLQTMTIADADYRATMEELIPGMDKTAYVTPPFHCDHGHGISLGNQAGCQDGVKPVSVPWVYRSHLNCRLKVFSGKIPTPPTPALQIPK